MSENQGTPSGETAGTQDLGSVENNSAASSGSAIQGDTAATDLAKIQAELAEERKARQQVEMERNNLRNKQDEDERKRLEESSSYKELWEKDRARLAELEADRDSDAVMAEYSPETQKLAKNLFKEGDLKSQLDALEALVKGRSIEEPETDQPRVETLNPNTTSTKPLTVAKSAAEELAELEASLVGKTFN